MRIAFFDAIQWDYVVASVNQHPLGGTQSAVCYLANQLSDQGHQVYLLNQIKTIQLSLGVICLPINIISEDTFSALNLDFLIVINDALNTEFLKQCLPVKTKLILWTGHDATQEGVQPLHQANDRNLYDYFVFVSYWQQQQFIEAFNIPPERTYVFANCAAPAFLDIDSLEQLITAKQELPLTLAYTSTPGRGLELLLDVFPLVQSQFPECRLKIFSSMKVYQLDDAEDPYQELYQRFQCLPGVEYYGSLPQEQLANELKSVNILCYPNTFPETGCIAVMEAMASGCQIITSDLGALSETTGGFATLIPITDDWYAYKIEFANAVIKAISEIIDKDNEQQLAKKIRNQINYIKEHHNWAIRTVEWESWLSSINTQQLTSNWRDQANFYSSLGQFHKSIELYDIAIQSNPEQFDLYIQAGILLILNHQEEEAQVLWSICLSQLAPEDSYQFTQNLEKLLQIYSDEQIDRNLVDMAITLRSYIIEFNPIHLESLIWIIKTATLQKYSQDFIAKYITLFANVIESNNFNDNPQKFLTQIKEIIKFLTIQIPTEPLVIEFIKKCLIIKHYLVDITEIIFNAIIEISHGRNSIDIASQYSEIYLKLTNRDCKSLLLASDICYSRRDYAAALQLIDEAYQLCHTPVIQAGTNGKRLQYLLTFGSKWEQAQATYLLQLDLLQRIIQKSPSLIHVNESLQLIVMSYTLFYMADELEKYQKITNQISEFCCDNILEYAIKNGYVQTSNYNRNSISNSKKIRVGYISYCLRTHSVGWLARHLLANHNREEFELYLYFIGDSNKKNDSLNDFYKSIADHYHTTVNDYVEMASKIRDDNIDILIDLDSITNDITSAVMCLKPAPIQMTWLGFNASGIPSIDYFLVDDYVLPDSAQSYYREKLWRLPNSYLCVDGFEVHFPTLKRCDLEIDENAVIFFSAQTARKRHPEVMRSQLEIIRDVPNSYFLIKGLADESSLSDFVEQMAREIGLSPSQLRFLGIDSTSMIHRANLGIADVILDTFPYNGATTTLEALWMGIPLVTRVGQQFAARNSYTFLKNAGVEEGIAWTNEEYVAWGIRLGTDHELRRKVAEKLRRARYSAPLWNAKAFTKEVEAAYQAMWHNYVTGEMILPPGHRIG